VTAWINDIFVRAAPGPKSKRLTGRKEDSALISQRHFCPEKTRKELNFCLHGWGGRRRKSAGLFFKNGGVRGLGEMTKAIVIHHGDEEFKKEKPGYRTGRPRDYETPEELAEAMLGYFKYCDQKKRYYSVAGLCLWLEISRMTLKRYAERDEFRYTVEKAKLMIIDHYTQKSLTPGLATGANFLLRSMGVTDKIAEKTQKGEGEGANGEEGEKESVTHITVEYVDA